MKRRATVLGSLSRSLETVSRLSSLVAGFAQNGLPLDELSQYASKVRAVTPHKCAMRRSAACPLQP